MYYVINSFMLPVVPYSLPVAQSACRSRLNFAEQWTKRTRVRRNKAWFLFFIWPKKNIKQKNYLLPPTNMPQP